MKELLKELEEARQKVVEIEKKIEEKQEEESGRCKPQKGDIYWFIDDTGRIYNWKWNNDPIDEARYTIGNCYQTKEECEFTLEKLKVIAELKEFEEPKDRKWDGGYLSLLYYDFYYGKVGINESWSNKSNYIYFESGEKARQAIDAVGGERIRKYYLEVEEEC